MEKLQQFIGKNKKLIIISAVLLIVGLAGIIAHQRFLDSKISIVSYTEFQEELDNDNVRIITYSPNSDMMTYATNDGKKFKTSYPDYDDFRKDMLEAGVELKKTRKISPTFASIVLETLVLIAYIFIMIFMRVGFGRLKKKDLVQKSNVKFDEVIGLEEIMDDISLYVSMIKNPDMGDDIGAKTPKGLLLAGAPGTGKTLIARAIAGEADVPFISVSGSEFSELYKGMGARRIRQVFKIARKCAPCIVFIDEIDAIGGDRETIDFDSEDTQSINQLLKEMDGFDSLEGVFVLAATNCPDKLDSALKRSGRFDRQINVNPPRDWRVRKTMLEFYLKDYKVAQDVNLDGLAKSISGFTGADISMICNEAGLVAIMNNEPEINMACIEEAIDKKVFNGNRAKSKQHAKDKEIVAYHESGHAVMKYLLGETISRASIIGTTSGVGGAVFGEEKESRLRTKRDIRNAVAVCYAGRTSEQIKFHEITTGAVNDIEKATETLLDYIEKYGFDEEVGPVDVELMYQHKLMDTSVVNGRLQTLAKDIEKETENMLRDNYNLVEALAGKLLEEETISGDEIKELLDKVAS